MLTGRVLSGVRVKQGPSWGRSGHATRNSGKIKHCRTLWKHLPRDSLERGRKKNVVGCMFLLAMFLWMILQVFFFTLYTYTPLCLWMHRHYTLLCLQLGSPLYLLGLHTTLLPIFCMFCTKLPMFLLLRPHYNCIEFVLYRTAVECFSVYNCPWHMYWNHLKPLLGPTMMKPHANLKQES